MVQGVVMISVPSRIKIPDNVDYFSVVDELGRSHFRANSAYELKEDEFAIDGGDNNVRAYWNQSKRCISFICRYRTEVESIERKLKLFSFEKHLTLQK